MSSKSPVEVAILAPQNGTVSGGRVFKEMIKVRPVAQALLHYTGGLIVFFGKGNWIQMCQRGR